MPQARGAPWRYVEARFVAVPFARCPISTCPIRSTNCSLEKGKSPKLVPEAPVYSSMSGSRLHPTVFSEMFRELVSDPGRAVTADLKPPAAHHLRRGFQMAAPLRWYRESVDAGMRPVHSFVFHGYVESASSVPWLTITADLLRAAG
jgi:hypothetical protein